MEKEGIIGRLIEPPRKQLARIQVPFLLRFAFIWTIVFAILGIVIQSIITRSFVFFNFFFSNYATWFRSFGSFVSTTEYNSGMAIFASIMSGWYYFFYTGGLISLLWGLVSWLVHHEVVLKRNENLNKFIPMDSRLIPIREQEKIQEHREKIDEWLEEGLRLLAEGNLEEAELIYKGIRKEYNPEHDLDKRTYKRILDFYIEIMDEKKAGKK